MNKFAEEGAMQAPLLSLVSEGHVSHISLPTGNFS